ncbi:MAG: tRNA (adenosine(37)-N6)-threonylcarbamoyltransferase complex ATPase subunit type 1 TsaE [Oscillospiraceae bacterium]|nr:tRNA (adenosine(37)-N6)-threonylcarbamoyltransferase complex ATPase subunit type 1 TsaE [Oscillospiraceae bacterium]
MRISESFCESETENIACNTAKQIKRGDIIALYGGFGAGKTAFVRGLVGFFLPEARVTSPTFALVNRYNDDNNDIFHFDMYRITGEEDLLSIGFYDYLDKNNIIIIEWFDKIQEFFSEHTVEVNIIKTGNSSRKITFKRI